MMIFISFSEHEQSMIIVSDDFSSNSGYHETSSSIPDINDNDFASKQLTNYSSENNNNSKNKNNYYNHHNNSNNIAITSAIYSTFIKPSPIQ